MTHHLSTEHEPTPRAVVPVGEGVDLGRRIQRSDCGDRGDRGQTAAEYVGVVALAAAAIGLILKLHIAEDIAQGLAESIKTILWG